MYLVWVSSNTSNAAVMGELGRHPLYIHYFCRCIKFLLNIIHNNASAPRLRTSMYKNLKSLDDNGTHTCATQIRYLLYRYGFGHVWLNQGVQDNPIISRCKQRLLDTSLQNWHSDVMDNRKLETYSTYKIDFCLETYLTIDMYHKHRIENTRFRCSSHNLAVEKLRPTHDRVDRVCKYCRDHGITVIEDEHHFLLKCPLYINDGSLYIHKYLTYPMMRFLLIYYLVIAIQLWKTSRHTYITLIIDVPSITQRICKYKCYVCVHLYSANIL